MDLEVLGSIPRGGTIHAMGAGASASAAAALFHPLNQTRSRRAGFERVGKILSFADDLPILKLHPRFKREKATSRPIEHATISHHASQELFNDGCIGMHNRLRNGAWSCTRGNVSRSQITAL